MGFLDNLLTAIGLKQPTMLSPIPASESWKNFGWERLDSGNNPMYTKDGVIRYPNKDEMPPRPTRMPSPTPTSAPTPTPRPSFLAGLLGGNPSPTASPSPSPMPTAIPTPYRHNITVPSRDGTTRIPDDIAQVLMNSFDSIGEATNSARVLIHPESQTYGDKEIWDDKNKKWARSYNFGENPNFKLSAPALNNDGSYDRGLMRNNSNTFAGMLAQAYWKKQMANKGINSFTDLDDPQKSADMGRLTLERGNWDSANQKIKPNPSWRQWYAAPLDLRFR